MSTNCAVPDCDQNRYTKEKVNISFMATKSVYYSSQIRFGSNKKRKYLV